MAVVRFALGRAVELDYGVDADLPHSLRDGSLLVADSDFTLVFVTAQFSLDEIASAYTCDSVVARYRAVG